MKARMYPNGECVIYRPRSFKMEPLVREPDRAYIEHRMARLHLSIADSSLEGAIASIMGLSHLTNFDKVETGVAESPAGSEPEPKKYGSRGITSYGARSVRNAAHCLEQKHGKARCIFATVTVPDLAIAPLEKLHDNWHKAVELYRLNVQRVLEADGLPGEMVSVSEIQELRHERTGLPVLHIHSVFCGVNRVGKYSLSTEKHDDCWIRAMNAAAGLKLVEAPSACNLQRVKKSASAYLAKYLSKGAKSVRSIIGTEYEKWLPKQWWNCTRSLLRDIQAATRSIDDMAEFLIEGASPHCQDVWQWHKDFRLEISEGHYVSMATFGLLKKEVREKIHAQFE